LQCLLAKFFELHAIPTSLDIAGTSYLYIYNVTGCIIILESPMLLGISEYTEIWWL